MQGHGDFALSKVGEQQAEKLACRLLKGGPPSHVYSSPLKRAAQTTQILMEHFLVAPLPAAVSDLIGAEESAVDELPDDDLRDEPKTIPVQYADELKEFQNGIFQGLTWTEARSRYPQLCRKLEASPDWIQIPEAESLHEARNRAKEFVKRLLEHHRNGDHIWIVTHSWILQHLVSELMGCDRSWRFRSENTAIFEFWVDQSRWKRTDHSRLNTDLWQVRRFNDSRHLI